VNKEIGMEQIILYGKGGVGKTTLAANLSAALAEAGKRVLLIGCDMKSDSSALLHERVQVLTVSDCLRRGGAVNVSDLVIEGYHGIACVELGDLLLDDECTSRTIGRALSLLQELDLFGLLQPDYVMCDIAGELGCTGVAAQLAVAPRQHSIVMTSGDLMSFYAANSYLRNIARLPGITSTAMVGNVVTGSFDEAFITDFARAVNVRVLGLIPHSLVVRHSELYGRTVLEASPETRQAQVYRRLARQIVQDSGNHHQAELTPLSVSELRRWAKGWGERLGELEFGIIQAGAGI
jgi:nitrogenase iron protein NifH